VFQSLSEQLVASLTKQEGHLVPKGVEEQISSLGNFRESLDSEYQTLKKSYEAYVRFCRSVGAEPEEIQPEQESELENGTLSRVKALRDELDSQVAGKGISDKFEGIPIGFAGIQRLRDTEEALKEIDALMRLLSGIVERIAKVAIEEDEEVRLLVTSSGKFLSFRLVYDIRSRARYVR